MRVVVVWCNLQVKSGTIFDNFLVTDDEEYAKQMATDTWGVTKDAEKKMKDKVGGQQSRLQWLAAASGFAFLCRAAR